MRARRRRISFISHAFRAHVHMSLAFAKLAYDMSDLGLCQFENGTLLVATLESLKISKASETRATEGREKCAHIDDNHQSGISRSLLRLRSAAAIFQASASCLGRGRRNQRGRCARLPLAYL